MVIALYVLAGAALAAPTPADLDVLDSYVQTVQSESILDATTPTLMQGASAGLRSWLQARGMRPCTSAAATTLEGFKAEFRDAMRDNPGADEREGFYASLKGMLEPLRDPYTRFMTPVEYRHLQARIQGTDEAGLGLSVEFDPKGLPAVATVFDGSPASERGIQVGDRLECINGGPLDGMTLQGIRDRLCGPEGSQVALRLRRSTGAVEVRLTRRSFTPPVVTWTMLAPQVGYIRLHAFSHGVAARMDEALAALRGSGAEAFVLDLRDNRGGYVSSALDVASRLLPAGTCVMSLSQKHEPTARFAAYPTQAPKAPFVVLVNQRTASASEIVAGALQDHRAATLVGVRTFGKGLVQKVISLKDGSAFAISNGRYLTPAGRDLHRNGVTPDVVVEAETFVPLPTDPNVKRALTLLERRLSGTSTPVSQP